MSESFVSFALHHRKISVKHNTIVLYDVTKYKIKYFTEHAVHLDHKVHPPVLNVQLVVWITSPIQPKSPALPWRQVLVLSCVPWKHDWLQKDQVVHSLKCGHNPTPQGRLCISGSGRHV